jgi:Ser-tRNA(Ala) deacylase AlaX
VPCGGTHLKRSGEVGNIALKRRNLGKGKERVEIYLLDE